MRYFFLVNYGDRPHCDEYTINMIEKKFIHHNVDYFIAKSKSIEHSKELIRKAAEEKYDCLLVGGGDGTINSVLSEIINYNMNLGIVPLGSLNCLARYLRIPLEPLKCIEETITKYKPKMFDLGKINNRYFIAFSSIGFDAAVCHMINKNIKIKLKRLGFILTGFKLLKDIKKLTKIQIIAENNKSFEGFGLLVSNIENYANKRFFNSNPFDGYMQAIIIKKPELFDHVQIFLNAFFSPKSLINKQHKRITSLNFTKLEIVSQSPMYLQIDGEAYTIEDNKHYIIEVLEKVIPVLCDNSIIY